MIAINSKELTMENGGVSFMEQTSHFARVLAFLEEKGWKYSHCCEDDCGSIDFEYRGVPYHIWEFHDALPYVFMCRKITGILLFYGIFIVQRIQHRYICSSHGP